MAVALRSSFDLVYLPDHGFVAEDGGEWAYSGVLPGDWGLVCPLQPGRPSQQPRTTDQT